MVLKKKLVMRSLLLLLFSSTGVHGQDVVPNPTAPETNLSSELAVPREGSADPPRVPDIPPHAPEEGSGVLPPQESQPSDLGDLEPNLETNIPEGQPLDTPQVSPEPRTLDLNGSTISPLPIVFPTEAATSTQSQSIKSIAETSANTVQPTTIAASTIAATAKTITTTTPSISTAPSISSELIPDSIDESSNSTNHTQRVSDSVQLKKVDGGLDLQTQVYIICGVYGGILLLLIILVLAIALSLAKIRDQIGGEMERYVPADMTAGHPTNNQIFAYENGAFNGVNEIERHNTGMRERSVDGDDDLETMGYSVYTGNKQNS